MDGFCRSLCLTLCVLVVAPANAIETLNEAEMGRVTAAGGGLDGHELTAARVDDDSALNSILQRHYHRGDSTGVTVVSKPLLLPALPSAASTQPIQRITDSPAGNGGYTSWIIMPGEQNQRSFVITDPRYSESGLHVLNDTRIHEIRQENVQFPGQRILDRAGTRTMRGLEVSSETMMFGR